MMDAWVTCLLIAGHVAVALYLHRVKKVRILIGMTTGRLFPRTSELNSEPVNRFEPRTMASAGFFSSEDVVLILWLFLGIVLPML
jgi:hypothetical protein